MRDNESDAPRPDGDNEGGQSFESGLLERLRQDGRDAADGKPVGRHYFTKQQMDRDSGQRPGQNQDGT